MTALRFERSLPRFAAARMAGMVAPGRGARIGPLRLVDADPPALPGPGWLTVRPRLSGVCGSDLATIDATSSRWFEPIVSFPFVPGHEVVGDLEDGRRVVLEAVLGCEARDIDPVCPACARGELGRCEHIAAGHLKPGLQTGYCADTGGGWSTGFVAHASQLHDVPAELSDEEAVMIEPTACAVHAVHRLAGFGTGRIAVIGAGTIGLCSIAALRQAGPDSRILVAARHPHQKALARELGGDLVVGDDEIVRVARRFAETSAVANRDGADGIERLTGGVDATLDCVGSAASIATALAITRPGGRVVLAGMPGHTRVDLTPLWQREIELVGAYAYGREPELDGQSHADGAPAGRRTFEIATDLVGPAQLGRLVSATYPLHRYAEALAHAAEAGRRGAVKIAFDLRAA
ncbi:MAG TPA: zinc-binding dehydrogenase [Acidimicrobiales bacterium]